MFDVSPTPRQPIPQRQGNPIAQVALIVAFGAMMVVGLYQMGEVLSTPQPEVYQVAQPTVGVEVKAQVEVIMPTGTPEPTPTATQTPAPSMADQYGVCDGQSQPGDVCVLPTMAPKNTANSPAGTPVQINTCDLMQPGALCVIPTPANNTNGQYMVD
jgi:hypothetical protein